MLVPYPCSDSTLFPMLLVDVRRNPHLLGHPPRGTAAIGLLAFLCATVWRLFNVKGGF